MKKMPDKITPETKRTHLTVYLPDTRGVEISRYGKGNLKIGFGVHTYSRLAGDPAKNTGNPGTCLGSTIECEAICYAKRISGDLITIYERNMGDDVPPIPSECSLLRLHISGDFNTSLYIQNWASRLSERPDVICWAYTRAWRVSELLPDLEKLRLLPNVQLVASMDCSTQELPPMGWRIAWIDGDQRLLPHPTSTRHQLIDRDFGDGFSFICPEETGDKSDCESCQYCFKGKRGDVTFLRH